MNENNLANFKHNKSFGASDRGGRKRKNAPRNRSLFRMCGGYYFQYFTFCEILNFLIFN